MILTILLFRFNEQKQEHFHSHRVGEFGGAFHFPDSLRSDVAFPGKADHRQFVCRHLLFWALCVRSNVFENEKRNS